MLKQFSTNIKIKTKITGFNLIIFILISAESRLRYKNCSNYIHYGRERTLGCNLSKLSYSLCKWLWLVSFKLVVTKFFNKHFFSHQKGHSCLSSLGIYINLSFIVLCLKIADKQTIYCLVHKRHRSTSRNFRSTWRSFRLTDFIREIVSFVC